MNLLKNTIKSMAFSVMLDKVYSIVSGAIVQTVQDNIQKINEIVFQLLPRILVLVLDVFAILLPGFIRLLKFSATTSYGCLVWLFLLTFNVFIRAFQFIVPTTMMHRFHAIDTTPFNIRIKLIENSYDDAESKDMVPQESMEDSTKHCSLTSSSKVFN